MRRCYRVNSICSLAACLAVGLAGCASWKESEPLDRSLASQTSRAPENRSRVILDVHFVNVASGQLDADLSESLWQWIDETAIDPGIRQRLMGNGLRVGVVANEERFRDQLSRQSTAPDVLEQFLHNASIASDTSHGTERVQLRMGRRYEMPLHQPIPGTHVALVRTDGETTGRSLQNAQYLFAITASPAETHRQVRLKFRPEVQYGDTRHKWVSSDSAIRIDSRRETWSLRELDVDLVASQDQTIVFSATEPMVGVGKHMLSGNGADQRPQQLVVVVKVSQIPSAIDQL